MDSGLIATLITAIATLLGVFGLWGKVAKVLKAIKESADVGYHISGAVAMIESILSDNVVTKDEVNQVKIKLDEIKKELKEAQEAWKDLTIKKK